jgi:hypothetical protein
MTLKSTSGWFNVVSGSAGHSNGADPDGSASTGSDKGGAAEEA